MNILCRAVWLLLAVFLSGCDIPADIRLTDTPINAPGSGATLDPTLPENIAAYFYADRPVDGLLFSCSIQGRAAVIGATDSNGRFVCSRDSTVSFFVGVIGERTLRLGQVELSIFGRKDDAGRRNNVLITPSVLYGTEADSTRNEVVNIFNLLTSFDFGTGATRSGRYQPVIIMSDKIYKAAIETASFTSLSLVAPPANFSATLKTVIDQMQSAALLAENPVSLQLVLADARPSAPTLSEAEAKDLTDKALLRARAGIYRINTLVWDTVPSGTGGPASFYSILSSFVIGNKGLPAGFSTINKISSSSGVSSINTTLLSLDSTAQVLVDGTLENFSFTATNATTLLFTGSLINDALHGSQLCNPSFTNYRVPTIYCQRFLSAFDYGRFFSSQLGIDGDLYFNRVEEQLPDIDLDVLPPNHLPRTFELSFRRYPDIQRAEFDDEALEGFTADKSAFGDVSGSTEQTLRYTLLSNGDVITDSDADCSAVTLLDGRYQDADSSEELLIGRVGSIFTDEVPAEIAGQPPTQETYLTLRLEVTESAHPLNGFAAGYPALLRDLFPMVLRLSTNELLPKSAACRVGLCPEKIEWFNDYVFLRDVYIPAETNPTGADALYKNGNYYGQITGNQQIYGNSGVCQAAPPPPPSS